MPNKIDRQKVDRCKQWLTQQKREKVKSQLQPIDTLDSDESVDEDELCVLRLNEATLVSFVCVGVSVCLPSALTHFLSFTASSARGKTRGENLLCMRVAKVH